MVTGNKSQDAAETRCLHVANKQSWFMCLEEGRGILDNYSTVTDRYDPVWGFYIPLYPLNNLVLHDWLAFSGTLPSWIRPAEPRSIFMLMHYFWLAEKTCYRLDCVTSEADDSLYGSRMLKMLMIGLGKDIGKCLTEDRSWETTQTTEEESITKCNRQYQIFFL